MTKSANNLLGVFSGVKAYLGESIAYIDDIPYYQTIRTKYEIIWSKEAEKEDIIPLFEELIKDIKSNPTLLNCWSTAVNNLSIKEKKEDE